MSARYSVWARNPNIMSIQYFTGLRPDSGTGNVRYTYRFTYENGAAPLAPGPRSTHPLGRSMESMDSSSVKPVSKIKQGKGLGKN